LIAGYAVHRFNIRSCGGTAHLCPNLYHGGLTVDLRRVLETLGSPAFVVGYSLGGNIVLKLAGELGQQAGTLMAGICAISTPIDLLACAARLGSRENRLYERRFVRKLGKKVAATGRFPDGRAARLGSLCDLDEQYTAVLWGFRSAADYYQSQSSQRYLDDIRVPALLVQSRDDPIIPFHCFEHRAIQENRLIELLVVDYGGHLGFLSKRLLRFPGMVTRFWSEAVVLAWMRNREP
jgi:predicted alpha/beta-fold hydrolase